MEMQNELEDVEPSKMSLQRRRILRRLTRAAEHAQELAVACEAVADEVTQLQATAYSAWMSGMAAMDREVWADAVAKFTSAGEVFDKLAAAVDLETAAICTERSQQLKAYRQFCANQLRRVDPAATALLALGADDALFRSKVQGLLAESLKEQARGLTSVEWLGASVPVRSERTRLHLTEAESLEARARAADDDVGDADAMADADGLSGGLAVGGDKAGSRAAVFGRAIACYEEALIDVRAGLREAGQARVKTEALEETVRQLQLLLAAVTFRKQAAVLAKHSLAALALRRGFDATRAARRARGVAPSTLVAVYDRLLAALAELQALVQDHPDARAPLDAREAGFRAMRLYYLACTYLAAQQPREALALALAARDRAAATALRLRAFPALAEEAAALDSLAPELEQVVPRAQAAAVMAGAEREQALEVDLSALSVGAAPPQADDAAPLLDRLGRFHCPAAADGYGIGALPPPAKLAPSKPFMFDLAANAFAYPALEGRVGPAPEDAPEEGAGVKGFWGRLWG
jgi:signal recognition particle subunit SRP68